MAQGDSSFSRISPTPEQRRFLENLFPGEQCLFEPEKTHVYGTDAGRLWHPPMAVVRPAERGQVEEFMAWAEAEKVPVHTRARATNVVGACVPQPGGVVLSTLGLNRVLEMDGEDFVAVVQPGVVTGDLQKDLEARSLFYPPDPASVRFSTVGGNVSTCAGGMRAVKYGVTRDFVLGIEAVLAGGRVVRFGGRSHKNVAGLDLTRLFVGAQGSLGVITELTLKLLPLPKATASVLACYADLSGALEAARAVFAAGILPTAMELMDGEVIKAVSRIRDLPFPPDAGGALLLKLDGGGEALACDVKRLDSVLSATGPAWMGTGLGAEEEEPLWEVRRSINPAAFQIAPDKIADDIAVPRSKVGAAIMGAREAGREKGLTVLCFGHLGDGNIHVNVMYDAAKGQSEAAYEVKERVLDLALSLGGTMSGEHGIGLVKFDWLKRQIPPLELDLMHQVKAVFDPRGIMNPGRSY